MEDLNYEEILDKVDKLCLSGRYESAKNLIRDSISPLFYPTELINLLELVELSELKGV